MGLAILVSGERTELMAEESSFMWMEISMMGSGPMTKPMDMGNTCM
jgi:hypothetical protein